MGKRIAVLLVGVALLASAPVSAFAMSTWAEEATYGAKTGAKLKYGLVNTFLGWTELFTEPYEATQYGENFFVGLGRGVWNGVADTFLGAAHAITFPIPQIDIPLPEGGTDILNKGK